MPLLLLEKNTLITKYSVVEGKGHITSAEISDGELTQPGVYEAVNSEQQTEGTTMSALARGNIMTVMVVSQQ